MTVQELQAHLSIYPKGTQIEAAFFERLLQEYQNHEVYFECLESPARPECAKDKPQKQLLSVDLNQDGQVEIVFFELHGVGRVYKKEASGWVKFATVATYCCRNNETPETFQKNLQAQLKAGEIKATATQWQYLKTGDKTYQVNVYQ